MSTDPATEVALKLVKEFEGCKLKAYPDPGTGGDPWTIGWGSTGPGIKPGVVWTQKQADDRLAADVKKFGDSVKDSVTYPANPNQMGAMISLAYNIGLAAFRSSTRCSGAVLALESGWRQGHAGAGAATRSRGCRIWG
jgi:lysozyme